MCESKKSPINLNYTNIYNSNSNLEKTINLIQTDLTKATHQNSNKINYRNRTSICNHKTNYETQKIESSYCRIKSSLKELKSAKERKRSKSFKTGFSGLYFNNIFLEILPLTAIIFHIPKNQKINLIFDKLCARIDNREFIRFKYNKKNGVVYIKFRNIFYYNYYFNYYKNRTFFKNTPILQMTKIEENKGMWAVNPFEEEEKKLNFNESLDEDSCFHNNYLYIKHMMNYNYTHY